MWGSVGVHAGIQAQNQQPSQDQKSTQPMPPMCRMQIEPMRAYCAQLEDQLGACRHELDELREHVGGGCCSTFLRNNQLRQRYSRDLDRVIKRHERSRPIVRWSRPIVHWSRTEGRYTGGRWVGRGWSITEGSVQRSRWVCGLASD